MLSEHMESTTKVEEMVFVTFVLMTENQFKPPGVFRVCVVDFQIKYLIYQHWHLPVMSNLKGYFTS